MKSTLSRFALILLGVGTGAPSFAQPVDRASVTDIKPLLKDAIARGSARGVLIGEPAAYVRQRFDTQAPIEVDVKSLHPLPQPGCHRLEVATRQRGVLENGTRGDKALVYQVSYCSDGSFPNMGDPK